MTKERLMPQETSGSDFSTNEFSEKYRCSSSIAGSQPWPGATNELDLKYDKVLDLLKPGLALPRRDGLKNKPDKNVSIILHKQGFYKEPSKLKHSPVIVYTNEKCPRL